MAICYSKHLNGLHPRDFPTESRQLFEVIRRSVRVDHGATKAQYLDALLALTEAEVETLAGTLVEIFDQVARYQPISEPP